jgi:hypothetical protein
LFLEGKRSIWFLCEHKTVARERKTRRRRFLGDEKTIWVLLEERKEKKERKRRNREGYACVSEKRREGGIRKRAKARRKKKWKKN